MCIYSLYIYVSVKSRTPFCSLSIFSRSDFFLRLFLFHLFAPIFYIYFFYTVQVQTAFCLSWFSILLDFFLFLVGICMQYHLRCMLFLLRGKKFVFAWISYKANLLLTDIFPSFSLCKNIYIINKTSRVKHHQNALSTGTFHFHSRYSKKALNGFSRKIYRFLLCIYIYFFLYRCFKTLLIFH